MGWIAPLATNSHPARLTAEEIRTLLKVLRVSGWSGTLAGLFVDPRPIPLLTEEELQLVSAPLALALSEAGPRERVFFSIPDPAAPYREDRIAAALFLRGSYAHLILTDHYAFALADTASGKDVKDPRDTKGMKLWVAPPAKPASLAGEGAPRWGPFETVRVSINLEEILAARAPAQPASIVK
jgi:hypothetical protein